MTFNPTVPNAGQSPGLFPAQSNTNYSRLKVLISGDHFFNDSLAANDGTHKQVTLTNRADPGPGSLPATTSGIFYSKLDPATSQNQLYFYNGTVIQQLTPLLNLAPARMIGSASVGSGLKTTVLDVPYNWSGTGHAWYTVGTATYRWTFAQFARVDTFTSFTEIARSGGDSDPKFGFTGTNTKLEVQNNAGSTQTIFWSIIINKNS